jgi:predicted RND superfamily exporter protein
MTWIESHLGAWVVRRRWWIIVLMMPLLAVAAAGVRQIRVSNDTRVFFAENNPDYQALEALEHTYSKEQSVFFVLAPKDGNVFTRATLAAVCELTEAGWRVPYSSHVASLTNFQHTRAEGEDLVVESLVTDPNALSDEQLETIRRTALSETAIVNRLISPAGHVAGIYVGLVAPAERSEAVPEVAEYARRLADDFRARHPDIDIYLTGSVMIDYAFAQASRQDMRRLIPAAFVVMSTLVGISLGSFYGTLAAVVVTVLSMVTALGLVGWLGVPLNAVSVGAPGLMLTLAIADNVHILTTLFHLMRQGHSKHEAIAKSLQINLKAIFLTNVTTILGFLGMNFSESPPFRDMGNIVGMGVSIDLVNSILLLPALMAVLPVSSRLGREGTGAWIDFDRLAGLVIRRRRLLLTSMLALVLVTSLGILDIELDDNFLTYFDDSFEFRRATDFLTKNLSGWDVIEYSLNAGQSGGITDVEYMTAVDRFASWYRQQPRVTFVATPIDTIKRLNRDMHGGDPNYYRVPDQRELAAQYLLLYELSLPFGQDLNSQIDVDRSATRFTVILQSMSANELCHMDAVARRWLAAHAPSHMATPGTGLSLIWARITRRNIGSMLLASVMEILIIAGMMFIALRSVKFTLLFLVPNLVPPFIAFGIWGLTKGRVGLALSVVVAMTLGIIVDDTIHFFVKYFGARREHGLAPEQAVRYTFGTVGAAIIITTVVLVSGFLVMMLSHYRMSAEMGLMCAMVIGLALMSDFFLTPALLMKFDRPAGTLGVVEAGKRVLRRVAGSFTGPVCR